MLKDNNMSKKNVEQKVEEIFKLAKNMRKFKKNRGEDWRIQTELGVLKITRIRDDKLGKAIFCRFENEVYFQAAHKQLESNKFTGKLNFHGCDCVELFSATLHKIAKFRKVDSDDN